MRIKEILRVMEKKGTKLVRRTKMNGANMVVQMEYILTSIETPTIYEIV